MVLPKECINFTDEKRHYYDTCNGPHRTDVVFYRDHRKYYCC